MERLSKWNVLLRLTLAGLLATSTPVAQGFLLAALVLSATSLHADEGTTILIPLNDNFLRQDQPNTNFGLDTTMHVQSRDGARNRRAAIRFSIAGIPATAAVKTSYLRMFMSDAPPANRTHNAHFITGTPAWTGTTATWNNRTTGTPWGTPGGDFNAAVVNGQATGTANNVTITWTIRTDGVVPNIPQLWVSNPATNLGVLIKDAAENNAGAQLAQYDTQNSGNPVRYPMLEIRYMRDVTLNAPAPGVSEVTLPWVFPAGSTAANYDGALFIKKGGTGAAFTFAPADGTAYPAGTNLGSGESVAVNTAAFVAPPTVVNTVDENGADSVVLPGTAYTYKSFTHDNSNIAGAAVAAPPHYAFGVTVNATTTTGGGLLKNWSYLTGAASLSPPAIDPGNVVLSGSNDSKLHSMSAATGGRNYRPLAPVGTTGGAIQSRPVLIPNGFNTHACGCDVAYASSADGRVYAFNAATGALLWQSAVLGNTVVGSPAVHVKAFALPSYPHAFDLVIVGTRNTGGGSTTNNRIVGLNGNTGATVWNFNPGNMDIISSSPVIDYNTNTAWVSSRAGATGNQPSLWKMDTATVNPAGSLVSSVVLTLIGVAANRHIDASPELDPSAAYVFAVTTGGDLVVVDHANPLNRFTTNAGSATGVGFPIVLQGSGANDDDVYFTTSGGVHKRIFDRSTQTFTGAGSWTTTTATLGGTASAPIYAPPPLATFLYVGVSDGRLKKLNPATGAIVLTRDVRIAPVAIVGDPSLDVISLKLYVGDSSGRIYSFDLF
jgi:outer membrane protein assembly factor BamB